MTHYTINNINKNPKKPTLDRFTRKITISNKNVISSLSTRLLPELNPQDVELREAFHKKK